MRMLVLVTLMALLCLPALVAADDSDVLHTLRPGHPRLLVTNEDIARVNALVKSDKSDPIARGYFDEIRKTGDKLLSEPVSERVIVGPRLLAISRQVLGRTTTLGALYRLTGDRRYADRARDEMLAAARFVDWNPSHFLDVAEMTTGLALGYDWIYDALSDEERAAIRAAIIEKGLKPGLKVYSSGKGWPTITNNWNQVCNGGLTIGALAVADQEPQIARQIIESARASLPKAMAQFTPDGGCIEGPGYWSYATRYTIFYLAALQTALGTDFGFQKTDGLAETGLFRIHAIAPTGRTFNFADAGDTAGLASQMFWMARAFDHPEYAAHERMMWKRKGGLVDAFHLLWFCGDGSEKNLAKVATAARFQRIDVALMRSAWNDPNAAFVGFKGGANSASHAHLDLGSFVYEADGVRWALDLGPDDYNLPGYFGAQRWKYYRLINESHNTLTIDGKNQNLKGKAPLVAFSGKGRQFAVADLTDAYGEQVKRALRGVELLKDRQLLVQDEITAQAADGDEPVEVTWGMVTDAAVDVDSDGNAAVLRKGEESLAVRILSPAGARFEVASANPPAPQRQQPDAKRLVIRLKGKAPEARIVVVLMTPGGRSAAAAGAAPQIHPLSEWIDRAK